VLDLIASQTVTLLCDDRILSEYREVLVRPAFAFNKADVEALLDFIDFASEHITGRPIDVKLPDPGDLPFLEVAIAGAADALVTGNSKHFKPVRGRHAVSVVSPAEFIGRF
jgi:predicted nucleic acid-binding protein